MISYVTLGSNDRRAAKAFYDAALAPLGLKPGYSDDEMVGYGPEGGETQLWVVQPFNGLDATPGNGTMLALAASTRAQVDAVYAAAISGGGAKDGPPRPARELRAELLRGLLPRSGRQQGGRGVPVAGVTMAA